MANLSLVTFGFSYSGTTSCEHDWKISHVDIRFDTLDPIVFTKLEESSDFGVAQYPPFFVEPNTGNQALDKINIKKVDTIDVTPALAKAINLSARIFKKENFTRWAESSISLKNLPIFKEGKCYWIQITQKAANTDNLQGEITEIDRLELYRRIKLARLYPDSMIYSLQKKTELTPDKEKIYLDYEAMVYGMGGRVRSFAEKVKLPPSENESLYEDLAREAIRKQVHRMNTETLKSLLDLKKEGDACQDYSLIMSFVERYQNALANAMGYGGYVLILREVLEAFAADKSHEETIQKTAAEFASNQLGK